MKLIYIFPLSIFSCYRNLCTYYLWKHKNKYASFTKTVLLKPLVKKYNVSCQNFVVKVNIPLSQFGTNSCLRIPFPMNYLYPYYRLFKALLYRKIEIGLEFPPISKCFTN